MFFKEQIRKRIKNEKGLTLIELLAVIVILAIIAAIAIPAIGNIIANTRDKAILSDVQAALSAAKIANADGSCTKNLDGTTTCKGDKFDFSSDKIANLKDAENNETSDEDITITFDENSQASKIVISLVDGFNGERIPKAINKANTDLKVADGSTDLVEGTKTFTVSEKSLNEALGGN